MPQADAGPSALPFEGSGTRAGHLFQLAIESLQSGVLIAGPDGRITFANLQLERLFGYERHELLGQSVDLLLPEPIQGTQHAAHRGSFVTMPLARGMAAGRELVGRRKDGSFVPVEIGLSSVLTETGLFVIASVVDATERRRQEQEHRRALAEGVQFDRLVIDVAAGFVNVPTEQFDEAILNALRRIVEALDVDRGSVFQLTDRQDLALTCGWARPDLPATSPGPPALSTERELPWSLAKVRNGELAWFSLVDEIPDATERDVMVQYGTRSRLVCPLSIDGRVIGEMAFATCLATRSWSPAIISRVRMVAGVFGAALARRQADLLVQKQAMQQVERSREKLQAENVYLRQEAKRRLGSEFIIGQSQSMRRVRAQIEQVAGTDSTVLLLGETGTGKELFATQIHELSARHGRPMVRVNCSAIPSTLIESELFGREKGAFTGALARQVGRFELADHSTIFLDEIGDLPADVQIKLLRVLEERQVERLGSPKSIHVDTRIVAATHRNLDQRIAAGTFREDLFYRLNVFPIEVPPLRERVDDIPLLVWRFVEEFCQRFGKRIDAIPNENMAMLQRHAWPGNIRELRNIVERAMIVATTPTLTITVPAPVATAASRSARLADVEKEHIRSVLDKTGWRIRGTSGAAERLGLPPTTLETRMAKLGISRPKSSAG